MQLAPPRLNVRAWFTLAVAVPVAVLAIAAAATATGLARQAGFWTAVVLAPAVALSLKTLESRRFGWNEPDPPWPDPEQTLRMAFMLTTGESALLFLAVLLGAPFSALAIVWTLAAAAAPLVVAVGIYLTHMALKRPLEAARIPEAIQEPDPGWREGPVAWMENVRLEEMAREREAMADVAWANAQLGRDQELRQDEQAVLVRFAGGAADGATGAGADVDQLVDGAGGGAAREVEAKAQILQQPRLETDEHGWPDIRIAQGGAQGPEGEVRPDMWFALWQSALNDGRSGGEAGEREGVVEVLGWAAALGLEGDAAELALDPGAITGEDRRARLKNGFKLARGPAGDVGGVAPMAGGEQFDDRPGLPEGAGGEHEGVVLEFHARKLVEAEAEIQPSPQFEAALAALKDLSALWRASQGRAAPAPAAEDRKIA